MKKQKHKNINTVKAEFSVLGHRTGNPELNK